MKPTSASFSAMFFTAMLDWATSQMPDAPAATAAQTKAAMTVVFPSIQILQSVIYSKVKNNSNQTCARRTLDDRHPSLICVEEHMLHSTLLGVI